MAEPGCSIDSPCPRAQQIPDVAPGRRNTHPTPAPIDPAARASALDRRSHRPGRLPTDSKRILHKNEGAGERAAAVWLPENSHSGRAPAAHSSSEILRGREELREAPRPTKRGYLMGEGSNQFREGPA